MPDLLWVVAQTQPVSDDSLIFRQIVEVRPYKLNIVNAGTCSGARVAEQTISNGYRIRLRTELSDPHGGYGTPSIIPASEEP